MSSTLIIAQAVDPNAGMSSRANYFAIATGCLDLSARKFYPLDIYQNRHPLTEQPEIVLREYLKWAEPPAGRFYMVGVETLFAQSRLFQDLLKDNRVPVKEIARRRGTGNENMNKMMRLQGLAGRYKRGDIIHPGCYKGSVWLPDYANYPWLQPFEEQLSDINYVDNNKDQPQHKQDDMADAWAACVELLSDWIRSSAAPQDPQYATFSIS